MGIGPLSECVPHEGFLSTAAVPGSRHTDRSVGWTAVASRLSAWWEVPVGPVQLHAVSAPRGQRSDLRDPETVVLCSSRQVTGPAGAKDLSEASRQDEAGS